MLPPFLRSLPSFLLLTILSAVPAVELRADDTKNPPTAGTSSREKPLRS